MADADLKKMKVAELRELLAARELDTKGVKDELVARLAEAMAADTAAPVEAAPAGVEELEAAAPAGEVRATRCCPSPSPPSPPPLLHLPAAQRPPTTASFAFAVCRHPRQQLFQQPPASRPRAPNFVFQIPGGTPSRCNPINAPAGCKSTDVENLIP